MKGKSTWAIAALAALTTLATAETPLHAGRTADAASGEIAIRLFAYSPAALTVPRGGTVIWTNGDDITHTVTSGAPGRKDARFDARLDGKGTAYRHTFTEPGAYAYFCDRHQAMTGQIIVK
ncbi:MAG TPA: plastocyanin/azurin family copper-binding protein [Methylomirabilota bacterium]|nr:plastocyanin/azurin family copper-binding protein [Methylomirabilota bacterium]